MITIRNYKINIKGTVVVKAEKNMEGIWELSSEPPGLLEQLLLTQMRPKREKK
jgi:hypothetical protein